MGYSTGWKKATEKTNEKAWDQMSLLVTVLPLNIETFSTSFLLHETGMDSTTWRNTTNKASREHQSKSWTPYQLPVQITLPRQGDVLPYLSLRHLWFQHHWRNQVEDNVGNQSYKWLLILPLSTTPKMNQTNSNANLTIILEC